MKHTPETVVLLDFGCSDSQKLARGIRDEHIYTMVMPRTVPVNRLMEEAPAGLIVCRDTGAPDHSEDLKKFQATGIPVMELEIKERNVAEAVAKAVDFCKNDCKCQGLWKLETFVDEAVADIRKQVGDVDFVLSKFTPEEKEKLPNILSEVCNFLAK